MSVKVIIPTALRQHTNNEDELQLNSRDVRSALQELVTSFPGLRRYLYSDNGRLRNFINIYLNEEDIRYISGEDTQLKDGDTLMIVPSVAGGSSGSRDRQDVTFSGSELARYSRHLIMPEVGLEGQKALKSASVLIIGAGGLGTPSATYLAAAGVGRIGIVDFDTIERSNLHRQVLYSEKDVGRSKADVAKERLLQINPNISIELYKVHLDSSNALDILKDYDIILDGTDNFPTRYLVNDACVLLGKPNVYASIFRFEGQASVFALPKIACFRCLYPEPPPPGLVPSCAEGGVLGVLPGIMGSIQAAEAIDLIIGKGTSLANRLLLFNALDMKFKELKLRKNPDCVICGSHPTITKLIDYEAFCGVAEELSPDMEVTARQLKDWMDQKKDIVVVDVREPWEYEINHIEGSRLIPLAQLPERMNELSTADQIVVQCASGIRSAQATRFLNSMGFKKAKNLKGGIKAWGQEVDPLMQMY
ncbi:MAG: molybdopterin-synthase adenylyltransferase MoeB [Thaumarchaeota archaeon]|nr:molybdopterin-synthase adenylyltransferase MoeB [Nitrososphaerota archaeon]